MTLKRDNTLNMIGQPRFERNCIVCGESYLGRQHNSKRCDKCRYELKGLKLCKCGCGEITLHTYAQGHGQRGKTYKEMYGDQIPTTGFKKGLENPNYTSTVFGGYKLNKKNSIQERFRSSLEVQFSEFCIKNSVQYKYEERYILNNGELKIVDFTLISENCKILVEITGYITNKWKSEFDRKCVLLRDSYPKLPILLLTYPRTLQELRENNSYLDIFIEDINHEINIMKKIELFKFMSNINYKHQLT